MVCTSEAKRLKWVSVVKKPRCNRYEVTVKINCHRTSSGFWFWGKNRPTPSQLSRLCALIRNGINRYWSRNIKVGSATWNVRVRTIQSSSGKDVLVKYFAKNKGNTRSHNSDILKMTMKYLSFRSDRDALFQKTAAHEIGHSYLNAARGLWYSWTHKGSSTIFQKVKSSSPPYPTTGEIDLMKYYNGGRLSYSRVKAAEADVKDLIFRVSGKTTTSSASCSG